MFWLHLAVGLTAGLVIFLMAATGFLLSFERQILAWLDDPRVEITSGRPALAIEELIKKTAEAHPNERLTGFTVQNDAAASVKVNFGREKAVNIDPYTAGDAGIGSPRLHDAFHFITELHRWLALSEASRETGKLITGVASLFFLFLIASGLYLWWPGRWTWHFLKRIIWFDKRLTKRAKDWNWHNVFGFWACIPLLLITLTGIIIAFSWANNLLYTLTGSEPPPPRQRRGVEGGQKNNEPLLLDGLAVALEKAKNKLPEWQSISVRLPAKAEAAASFSISGSHRGRPDKKAQLEVDLASGEEKNWEPFSSYNAGRQLRFWARWVHTGEAGGVLGQILAAFAAVSAMVLVWTGFALSWRRFFKTKRQPKV